MELSELFDNGKWYHCIQHGELISNGTYDLNRYLRQYHLEQDYTDRTVLDVGCADGFFSFLVKERGASRVCAIDANKYDGSIAIEASRFNTAAYKQKYQSYVDDFSRFRAIYDRYGLSNANKLLLLARLKGVEIEYHTGTVYDLRAFGTFDVVLCNDLLEHLRDPITAIEQIFLATKHQAVLSVSSALKRRWGLGSGPWLRYQGHRSGGSFYQLSEAAVRAMCQAAGFRETRTVSRFDMENRRSGGASHHCVIHAFR
jgi:SAM-dependent methyltransferase